MSFDFFGEFWRHKKNVRNVLKLKKLLFCLFRKKKQKKLEISKKQKKFSTSQHSWHALWSLNVPKNGRAQTSKVLLRDLETLKFLCHTLFSTKLGNKNLLKKTTFFVVHQQWKIWDEQKTSFEGNILFSFCHPKDYFLNFELSVLTGQSSFFES